MNNVEDAYRFADPVDITLASSGYKGLNFKGKVHFYFILRKAERTVQRFYEEAIAAKECYYGPFKGEFGHFLLHNLPFLQHLSEQGVRIHYCGMTLHKDFLRNESGESIIAEWYSLRDFFSEVKPVGNAATPPADVQDEIERFRKRALQSGKPFLDIGDNNMYWYVFRNWQLDGRQKSVDLSRIYPEKKKKAAVIFPRKKGGTFTPNNGGPWDYMELARAVAPYFDEVWFTGHPSMSADIHEEGNIRSRLSEHNEEVIRTCVAADLIITQHSGAVHLGGYAGTDILIIFNGKPPIKGLTDTLRFRKNLTERKLSFAFSYDDIVNFLKQRKP